MEKVTLTGGHLCMVVKKRGKKPGCVVQFHQTRFPGKPERTGDLPGPPDPVGPFRPQSRFIKKTAHGCVPFSGDPAGIRTPDPLLKRQLLCRLSYRIMAERSLNCVVGFMVNGRDGWTRTSE